MKLKKILKISLGALVAFPLSFFIGNELLANNFNDGILKLQILIMIILLQVKVASGARKLGIGNTIQ